MADWPVRSPGASPPAVGPFDQIRCPQSRRLLTDGYRAALRADQVAQASIGPTNPKEKEN